MVISLGQLQRRLSRLVCWWRGCVPDWDKAHYENSARWSWRYKQSIVHRELTACPCKRCDCQGVDYASQVGDSRQKRFAAALRHQLWGRWRPAPCSCGRRGAHQPSNDCIPF